MKHEVHFLSKGIGDHSLAYQCLRLTLTTDNGHVEAYNNLAVLELRNGHVERARALLRSAADLAPQTYEAHYNQALLAESVSWLALPSLQQLLCVVIAFWLHRAKERARCLVSFWLNVAARFEARASRGRP